MSPEELERFEAQIELQRREKELADSLNTSLTAVAEAMGDELQVTKELNAQNNDRLALLEKQVKLQALGKDLNEDDAKELAELTENTKEFAEALRIANEARREEIDLQKELLDVTRQLTGLQLDQLGTVRGLTTSLIDRDWETLLYFL